MKMLTDYAELKKGGIRGCKLNDGDIVKHKYGGFFLVREDVDDGYIKGVRCTYNQKDNWMRPNEDDSVELLAKIMLSPITASGDYETL